MNQSTKILGFIATGFVIFITARGELPTYLGFLFGTGQGASSAPTTAAAGPSPASGNTSFSAGDALRIGAEVAAFL